MQKYQIYGNNIKINHKLIESKKSELSISF